jgi:SAM-dependent methyltransferase
MNLRADCIFSSLVLHHIPDTAAILRRFYEALNPGGRRLCVDLERNDGSFHGNHPGFDGHNGFDRAEPIALTQAAGFAAVSADILYTGRKQIRDREVPYALFVLDAERA